MSVIDEPHDAVAASRCLTARSLDTGRGAVTAQHPRRCTWCAIDLAELTRMVEGWNAWADPRDRGRSTVYVRHAARTFVEWARKQPAEAEALIAAAQGLEPLPGPEPQAIEAPQPPPAHDPSTVDEDVSAWM